MAGLFPPQDREWSLPAEAPLTPQAARRLGREAATQQGFGPAARALSEDWAVQAPLHAEQVRRWGEALGASVVARREAEVADYRRGLRQAEQVIALGDGGNWIDPLLAALFHVLARIIDWFHASEHLWDCAKAVHGAGTPQAAQWAERLEALLWDGQVERVIAELSAQARELGPPLDTDADSRPRKVLAANVGYFTTHRAHMNYPEYRRRGWPIGSGETEAAVKQFNKRVKGTEQFWSTDGVEAILGLRGLWLSQDDRWQHYWENRCAYVN